VRACLCQSGSSFSRNHSVSFGLGVGREEGLGLVAGRVRIDWRDFEGTVFISRSRDMGEEKRRLRWGGLREWVLLRNRNWDKVWPTASPLIAGKQNAQRKYVRLMQTHVIPSQ